MVALSLAGAGGAASFVLLPAIILASTQLILAVGDSAEDRGDRRPVVMSAGAVVCLVAAGAAHVPLLALGALACAALELLASRTCHPELAAQPVELTEVPASRAA